MGAFIGSQGNLLHYILPLNMTRLLDEARRTAV